MPAHFCILTAEAIYALPMIFITYCDYFPMLVFEMKTVSI